MISDVDVGVQLWMGRRVVALDQNSPAWLGPDEPVSSVTKIKQIQLVSMKSTSLSLAIVSQSSSAAVRVYEQVKESILTSEIPGGDLISEGEIASRYDVSRTPVREAFLRLESEGWMRLYPKRGALVLPVAERDAADVIAARLLLEGHSVAQVVGRPSVRDNLVANLRANIDAHRNVDPADLAAFTRLDAAFHQLIVSAGDNPLLAGFFTSLGERHRRMTSISVQREQSVIDRIIDDHTRLADAVAAGDRMAFDASLAQHLWAVHRVGTPHRPEGEPR